MATVSNGVKAPKVTTAKGFLEFCKEVGAVQVDLKFVDMLGTWQHCSYPMNEWDEGTFVNGLGFDGSSIRGWQAINASDMLAVPDPTTAMIDPFYEKPTVSVIANIIDPITQQGLQPGPAVRGPQGGGVPAQERGGGHGVHGAGAGVLHFR